MKRTNFYFPEPMLEELKSMSRALDIPTSELIRRAVRIFLDHAARQNDKAKAKK